MILRRVNKLDKKEQFVIRNAQSRKRLKRYVDKDGFLCFDLDEYHQYKTLPRKKGRKVKGGLYV